MMSERRPGDPEGLVGGPRLSGTPDLCSPWDIIRAADAADSGIVIDLRHHMRDGRDDAPLETNPADRITAVQPHDADAEVRERMFPASDDLNNGKTPG